MNQKPKYLVSEFEPLEKYQRLLEEEYPFVHAFLNNGVLDFIEKALSWYHSDVSEEAIGEYITAYIDESDFKIDQYKDENPNSHFDDLIQKEIYSNEFFNFLSEIYHDVIQHFKDIVCNDQVYFASYPIRQIRNGCLVVSIEFIPDDESI